MIRFAKNILIMFILSLGTQSFAHTSTSNNQHIKKTKKTTHSATHVSIDPHKHRLPQVYDNDHGVNELSRNSSLSSLNSALNKRFISSVNPHLSNVTPLSSPYITTTLNNDRTTFKSSVARQLVDFVHNTVNTFHYSIYRLGGELFDTKKGVYIVDCSRFVDKILQKTCPKSYSSLVDATGADAPASSHYYHFFNKLTDTDSNWNKVHNLDQLRAGDILVLRYKNARGNETGGHVMVVMDKPHRDTDVFYVRVADSAPTRHSHDTREYNTSGIGIGTLLLKANSKTGHPTAYAWGVGGLWKKNVNFAMARPMEIG